MSKINKSLDTFEWSCISHTEKLNAAATTWQHEIFPGWRHTSMVPVDRSQLHLVYIISVLIYCLSGTFPVTLLCRCHGIKRWNLWIQSRAKGISLCLFCGIEMARNVGPMGTQHVEFMKQEENKKTELLQV